MIHKLGRKSELATSFLLACRPSADHCLMSAGAVVDVAGTVTGQLS